MSLPFDVFNKKDKNCEHKFKAIEDDILKKLGKKRCGDFKDPGKYDHYKPTPKPEEGTEKHIPGNI